MLQIKDLKKRTTEGHRYQPVHFAACNEDSSSLIHIVTSAKECASTLDGRNRRPIHYAAACQTSDGLLHMKNSLVCFRVKIMFMG